MSDSTGRDEAAEFLKQARVYATRLEIDTDLVLNEATICKDKDKCKHPYLNKWDGELVCMDCYEYLNPSCVAKDEYAARVAHEEELERNTSVDVIHKDIPENKKQDYIGKLSQGRGVKLGFLLEFTRILKLWGKSAAEVIRLIVKPLTKHTRCRFVELPCMEGHIGEASTFISYAQAGSWGDLIAALLDGGDRKSSCRERVSNTV